MTDRLLLIALGIYAVAYFYSRGVQRAAQERLDTDQKALLGDAGTASPSLVFGAFVVAILGYVLATRTWPGSPVPGITFATGLLALYLGFTARQVIRFRRAGLPGFFLRAVVFGRLAQSAALVTLIILLAAR